MDEKKVKVKMGDIVTLDGETGVVIYIGTYGFTLEMTNKSLGLYSVLHNRPYTIMSSPKIKVKTLWTQVKYALS